MNKQQLAALAYRERRAGRDPSRVLAAAANKDPVLDFNPSEMSPGGNINPALGRHQTKEEWRKNMYDMVRMVTDALKISVENDIDNNLSSLIASGVPAMQARNMVERRFEQFFKNGIDMVINMPETYGA